MSGSNPTAEQDRLTIGPVEVRDPVGSVLLTVDGGVCRRMGEVRNMSAAQMAITERRPLVTLLDSREIAWEMRQSFLNETEKQEAAAISNSRGREDWIAGRIASKWAFLFCDTITDSSESSALCLQKIGRTELAAFSAEEYRAVSVIRN